MNGFLKELSERRRFGMKPGLDTIRGLCAALDDPQKRLRNVIHVAGTNGKGAVCAILDAALGGASPRCHGVARYTSPHLVRINERFFLNGSPISDEVLERAAAEVSRVASTSYFDSLTFFEALTAVAFVAFAEADPDWTILETGLGGRLDATNICLPQLSVITRIGLDHCDWLGDTVEKIAAEKAGIIKPAVPVVLARNEPSVIEVVRRAAAEQGSPFFYAPEVASDADIPADFPLNGSFNRENAVTAIAALKVLEKSCHCNSSFFTLNSSLSSVVWPGRFQRIGDFFVDGAHNPPAARALADALAKPLGNDRSARDSRAQCSTGRARESRALRGNPTLQPSNPPAFNLICGFCGDKDALEVLKILRPLVKRGFAVRTNNPRSLSAEATAALMNEAGLPAQPCASLKEAISSTRNPTVICGSLFLAGEALVELGAYPWGEIRYDPSELLKTTRLP